MDGIALQHLVGDLEELRLLIPQAGMRLKLKAAVRKVYYISYISCYRER